MNAAKVSQITDGPKSRAKVTHISEAVAKALMDLGLTADAVLRDVLNIHPEGFTTEGVTFPEGTYFRTWYKERPYWGVIKNGAIEMQGKQFTSVSAAAAHITGRPTTNGWEFWECRFPKRTDWVRIGKLKS